MTIALQWQTFLKGHFYYKFSLFYDGKIERLSTSPFSPLLSSPFFSRNILFQSKILLHLLSPCLDLVFKTRSELVSTVRVCSSFFYTVVSFLLEQVEADSNVKIVAMMVRSHPWSVSSKLLVMFYFFGDPFASLEQRYDSLLCVLGWSVLYMVMLLFSRCS